MNLAQRIFAVPQKPAVPHAAPPGPPAPAGGAPAGPPAPAGGAPAGPPATGQNVFLTPESLASFPGASLGIGILLAVTKIFVDVSAPNEKKLVVLFALLVGAAIFFVGISTPGSKPASNAGWVIAILAAVINAFMLATTVLGVPVLLKKETNTDKPPVPAVATPTTGTQAPSPSTTPAR